MKKLISVFLVFSILNISCATISLNHAETKVDPKKKGTDLIIQNTDGTLVRGELIAVKQNSLLLLHRASGADVTIKIEDIGVITIVKKSKLVQGAGWGGLSGVVVGASYYLFVESPSYWFDEAIAKLMECAGICACIGLAIGGLVGLGAGINKTIQMQYKSDSEIQKILVKLNKKARVKNSQ